MAARRLIVVLVILIAASVVAATLAPDRTGQLVGVTDENTESTTETTTPEPGVPTSPESATGDTFEAEIEASAKKPPTVEGFVGDQLTLLVGADPPRTIAIVSLGLSEFAAENAPARFDLLLREPDTYAITDGDDPDLIIGRLNVSLPPNPDDPPADDKTKPPKKNRGDKPK